MALTTDQVRKIASLARLRFTPEEERRLAGELGAIVDYIDQLQGAPGDAVPAGEATAGAPEAEDRARPGLAREVFLANAPAAALGAFLVVPEVKGGGGEG